VSEASGNPNLPNEQTDTLAGWLGVLMPGVQIPPTAAEQLHQLLLLGGWREPAKPRRKPITR
jgi:hypothetical protein